MKENKNIEEIIRQKFENFQPEVDPAVWAGIQSGLSTAAVSTGIGAGIKVALISGGIIAASVATWYFGFYNEESTGVAIVPEVTSEQLVEPVEESEALIVVNDANDPVIIENKEKIEEELRKVKPDQDQSEPVNENNLQISNPVNQSQTNPINAKGEKVVDNNEASNTVNTENSNPSNNAKPTIPSGRMEYIQHSNFAPSAISFESNCKNQKEVRWDFGDGTTATGASVKHTYSKPGKYQVKLTVVGLDKTQYEETQEVVVKSKSSIDNVPNVITPNGDRINDYFSVTSTNLESFVISIRDAKGNEVFNSTDKDFSWDGTDYEGNVVEKGLYTYLIIAEGTDGSVIKLPGQIYVQ